MARATTKKPAPRKPRTPKAQTRAERNIAWIEKHCFIPEGPDVGKPVRLREWQRDQLRAIYDNPHGTRRAIISFGRKNAKTTICAFLLLLHLARPESLPNGQLFSAAHSRNPAGIHLRRTAPLLFKLVLPGRSFKHDRSLSIPSRS